MIKINTTIQGIIFLNHTKQEAERWIKKYKYKIINEPIIYMNKDGYIEKRIYELKDPSSFGKLYNKRINKDIYFIMGYYS